jgi:hypothetical protein
MWDNLNINEQEINSTLYVLQSLFTQSSRFWWDWVKEKSLCALCAPRPPCEQGESGGSVVR